MSREHLTKCDGAGCTATVEGEEGWGTELFVVVRDVLLNGPCAVSMKIGQDSSSPDYASDLCPKCRLKLLRRAWQAMGVHLTQLEREEGIDAVHQPDKA